MKLSPVRYGGKAVVLAWSSGVTEGKKKMLQLQRLHRRLRSILDSMHHVVLSFSFDKKADKARVRDATFYDRHLVEINPAAETLYGVSREEFFCRKRSIFDFIHEEDKETVLHHYHELHKDGVGELTYRVVRLDSEIRWVQDFGKVEYREKKWVRRVNRIIEDITEKKKALDELKASEEKYRRIFERSKDMIYVVESDGSFIDINPAGVKLLGLGAKEEAVLRNINEFYVDSRVSDELVGELMEKGDATRGRVMLRNGGGEIIEVDLNAIARRDGDGKVISYQGIVTNITEALRQQELEAIGQLAGCFADDLASPLNVIMIGLTVAEDVLSDLRKIIDQRLEVDKAPGAGGVLGKIDHHLDLIAESQEDAGTACKEITRRLKEIREEYWRLRRVSDGNGGTIYERLNKMAREGMPHLTAKPRTETDVRERT